MNDTQNLMIPGRAGGLSVRTKGLSGRPAKTVVLVQGANMSGQMGYDFSFPGGTNYSMMDAFVAAGFGAVTFSVRGYARSELNHDAFGVQTEQAIEDLGAVVDWMSEQGHVRPHLLGWSWGGRITGRYVQTEAAKVGRLVLLDPALGGGNKVLPAPTDAWWSNTHKYFYERLEKELMDIAALDALGHRMEAEEPRSPNGIRRENANGSVATDPTRIACPTLMLYGVEAGRQNYMQGGWDRLKFFEALATDDKAFVLVPGGGDYAHLQNPRGRIFEASIRFLATD